MRHSKEIEEHKILKSFISGGVAGSLNKTLIAPVERVKYLFVVNICQSRLLTGILHIGSLSTILLS